MTDDQTPPTLCEGSVPTVDLVGDIIAFENGDLDAADTLRLFQHLVDTGLAWTLQGAYGRYAADLLQAGMIVPARRHPLDDPAGFVDGITTDWKDAS